VDIRSIRIDVPARRACLINADHCAITKKKSNNLSDASPKPLPDDAHQSAASDKEKRDGQVAGNHFVVCGLNLPTER
jgi:hypothetical protein